MKHHITNGDTAAAEANEVLKKLLQDIKRGNFAKYEKALKMEKRNATIKTTRNSEQDYKNQIIKIHLLDSIFNIKINGLFSKGDTRPEIVNYLKQDTGRHLKRLTQAAGNKTILVLKDLV